MTMYKFLAADEMEQVEAFWGGVYIGELKAGNFKIICKQINEFYVEYKVKDEMYVDMRVFKNPDLLVPYLDQMEIKL